PNDAPTDAKLVLEALCGADHERRRSCLDDLERLRERGGRNGAEPFLREVEDTLAPRLGRPAGE
ncbi:MAG: hypothetical protein KDK70_20185, partial [Myxococcales bacterium]|nr:hypothetical protein [Myxococcales bacterium]